MKNRKEKFKKNDSFLLNTPIVAILIFSLDNVFVELGFYNEALFTKLPFWMKIIIILLVLLFIPIRFYQIHEFGKTVKTKK